MSQLNIAMLSYHTCPLATLGGKDTGGMNVYVREITKKLGEQGVHVDVFTRSQDEHVPHVLHDLGFGNRVVHIPSGPEIPMPKQQLAEYIPEFVQGIKDFAQSKDIRYDLIHSHYWMSGIAAIDLKREWGAPIIQMFHTLGLMKNRVAQSESEKEGDYRIGGEQRVIQSADRIIAATPAELSQLQFLYNADGHKINIIPPGVDICHFYPIPEDEAREFIGIPPCKGMLLFVGRIEPLKGLDILLEAIAIMKKEHGIEESMFCLSVIGGDLELTPDAMSSEMLRLQRLREKYGLEEMVALLGKRSQDTLAYYYSAAKVVVMPSHYESFGMVALEAMACGTPVVASDVGGLAYLVKDGVTGFTVPAGDPWILADRLTQLLYNENQRQQMGDQAAQYAREYAWESITQRIRAVYAELLERACCVASR
jgi:D-inositol-3-phosphate glycosyltransferase